MRGLDHTEKRKVLKELKRLGIKPPNVGYCVTVKPNVELCRKYPEQYTQGGTGYQIVSSGPHGLLGSRRRRKRR